jgi:hypothetical protein
MKQCRECQVWRHELAQIDVYAERYQNAVNGGADPPEVRRRAVVAMGSICDRLDSLKNTRGVPNNRDRSAFIDCTPESIERQDSPAPAARSSLRTVFELRARPWFVRTLIALISAGASWWVTHHFVSK